jgi:hypothetical protein
MNILLPADAFSRIPFSINGFNYSVPSDRELHEILATFPDTESVKTFHHEHEITIKGIKLAIGTLDESLQTLCVLIGQEYTSVLKNMAICHYYQTLFSGKSINPQRQYKMSLELEQKASKALESDNPVTIRESKPFDFDSLCDRFPVYEGALTQLEAFCKSAFDLAKKNPIARNAYLKSKAADKATAYSYKKQLEGHLSELPISRQCLICQKFFSIKRGFGKSDHILCGQESCHKEYKRLMKTWERRNKAPESIKPFVAAFDKKPRPCRMCGEKKQVNLDLCCKKCSSKTLS